MTFSIEEFKSSTQHGFLKPSNFLVYIHVPQCIQRVQDNEAIDIPNLIYLTAAASLPGIQILTTENKIYGQGPTVKMPYDIGVTDMTLKFYVDAGSKSMVYFYNWLRNVVNLSHRQDEARQGAFSNQVSYRKDYETNIDILLYGNRMRGNNTDEYEGSTTIFTLYDAYPISIAEPQLDWQSGNEIMTFSVVFTYRSFEQTVFPLQDPVVGSREVVEPAPVDLSEFRYRKLGAAGPDGAQQDNSGGSTTENPSLLNRINKKATNIREASFKIRTESVSQLQKAESAIAKSKLLTTAGNIVGTVNDVKKTIGVLKGLNNTLKQDLKQQLKTTLGGKSLKNLTKF